MVWLFPIRGVNRFANDATQSVVDQSLVVMFPGKRLDVHDDRGVEQDVDAFLAHPRAHRRLPLGAVASLAADAQAGAIQVRRGSSGASSSPVSGMSVR